MASDLRWSSLAEIAGCCIVSGDDGGGVDLSSSPGIADLTGVDTTFFGEVHGAVRRWGMILRDSLMAWKEYVGDR